MLTKLKRMALGASTALTMTSAAIAGPYDAYEGTTLVVNFPAHPHYNAVMKILPEFTKETGIEVEVDQLPLSQNAGTPDFRTGPRRRRL